MLIIKENHERIYMKMTLHTFFPHFLVRMCGKQQQQKGIEIESFCFNQQKYFSFSKPNKKEMK